ncbi:MAG TPA: CoA-binding protein [Bdellovibrionota bacterium]|nr:CoA-binding protein [Bdellovibrionota bacterium]
MKSISSTIFGLAMAMALWPASPTFAGETKTMSQNKKETVLVIGAHTDPTKYANKAQKLLTSYGHDAIPINPNFKEVLGKTAYTSVSEWAKATGKHADTVTMYVRAQHSTPMTAELVALKPRRVIFNPNTENPVLKAALEKAGIETVENCTLVMLDHDLF